LKVKGGRKMKHMRLLATVAMVMSLVIFGAQLSLAADPPPYPGERVKGKESPITVAAIQIEPHVGDKDYNLKKMAEFIDKAADQGATLLVLPELANSGYIFNSREEAFSLAEPVPGGPTTDFLIEKAKERNLYIVSGIDEIDGNVLYNSAVLVGPEGYIGTYRKNHLWDEEKLFFEHGNLGFPVFDLPFGRVGMMICYDGWFPETTRILRLQGADIVLNPTNWVYVPGVITEEKPVSPDMHSAFAHANSMFIISADRVGLERGCTFLGLSNIAGPGGTVKRAAWNKEEIITAEINVIDARYTIWTKFADLLKDRRTDLYDMMLGYEGPANPRVR
jgi:N-carbamoylputrescine amidase